MKQSIMQFALVVNDYDEAIDFYVNKLHFDLVEDTKMSDTKRWILIRPKGTNETCILLAKAATDEQRKAIGDQSGGRVFLFLQTDNLDRDHKNLMNHQIQIVREPSEEEYGKVLVFADLYGNKWDLIEPTNKN